MNPAIALKLPVFLLGIQEQLAELWVPLGLSKVCELYRCKGPLRGLGRWGRNSYRRAAEDDAENPADYRNGRR